MVGSYETFKKYTDGINNTSPINLRDLLDFKKSNGSIDLSKIIGKKSEEIEEILGYLAKTEVIHRNNLFYSGNMDEK